MATLLGLLPLILQVLGIVLKWVGAGEDVLEKYKALIESTSASGLITVKTKDKLIAQRQAIIDRQKAKQEQAGKP